MTKAPFSVEWLSQSSQATSKRPQRADGARGGSRGFVSPLGNPACSSSPAFQALQPAGCASRREQRGEATKSLDKGARGETPLDPSPARAAPAAAQRAWRATESGSEWDSGRSECQSPEAPSGKGSRRLRTAFSVEQISTLESSFKRHKYLGSAERRKLAAKMQLSEVQIKTWFQNRRMKLKRQLQEVRPEPFYSPVPLGTRGGTLPLRYLCPQLLAHFPGQEAPASFTFPALSSSACGREPGAFWQAPCFVGYVDPRTFLLPV